MFTNTSSSSHGILEQCPPMGSRPLLMIESTKWPPIVELAPNCPRCASSNTKFCYYNNYSLSQPRYFCKGCRRYWTKGGSLRNMPVGGGCRKSRRARRHAAPDHVGPAHDPPAASVGSSEIDMAAVYAKYVNSNADEESYSPGDGSGSSSSYNVHQTSASSDCNAITTTTMFDQYDNLDSMVMPADIFVDQDMNAAQDDGFAMMSEDSNVFELLADDHELGLDALWSSGTELQDFGAFSENNDQFGGTSTNNNQLGWFHSIDISSHEIFSRNLNFD